MGKGVSDIGVNEMRRCGVYGVTRDLYGFEDERRLVLIQKGRHCPRGFSVSHVVLSFAYVVVQLESVVSAVMSVHVAFK